MEELQIGMSGEASLEITEAETAATVGSGSLRVLATPVMCALMEKAACAALAEGLELDTTSVGTRLNISHDRATAVGETVIAKATLMEVEGRRLEFIVEAYDSKGLIGRGEHQRFLVVGSKFLKKVYGEQEDEYVSNNHQHIRWL